MKLHERNFWTNNQPKDKGKSDCPFCKEQSEYYIHETKHWRIMHNKYPVLGLKENIMAAPKKHFILAKDMPEEVFADYKNVENFVADFYKNQNYFTFMRESLSSRSIEHLHYHFLPGQLFYKHLENMLLEQGFQNQFDLDQN